MYLLKFFSFVHITAGLILILSIPLVYLSKKGSATHMAFGKMFILSISVACTSVIVNILLHASNFEFLPICILPFYLILALLDGVKQSNKWITWLTKLRFFFLLIALLILPCSLFLFYTDRWETGFSQTLFFVAFMMVFIEKWSFDKMGLNMQKQHLKHVYLLTIAALTPFLINMGSLIFPFANQALVVLMPSIIIYPLFIGVYLKQKRI